MGENDDQISSDQTRSSLDRILWGCESNLAILITLVAFGGICLLGIFNRPSKPLTIELPFPVRDVTPTPTEVPVRKYSLASIEPGKILIVTSNQPREVAMAVLSGNQMQVTPIAPSFVLSNTSPALSPDQQNAAFISSLNGRNELFVSTSQGVQRVPYTGTLEIPPNTMLAWSPDNQHLAFIATREQGGILLSALYVITASQITTPTQVAYVQGQIDSPVWIDNIQIAYVRTLTYQPEEVIVHSTQVLTDSRVIYPPTPTN